MFIASSLLLAVLGLYTEVYLQSFFVCPFNYTALAVSGNIWIPITGLNTPVDLHTSWVVIVTLSDRPKSVRNCCVIEVFGGIFVLQRCFCGLFCEHRGFGHRTESDLFLFLFSKSLQIAHVIVIPR